MTSGPVPAPTATAPASPTTTEIVLPTTTAAVPPTLPRLAIPPLPEIEDPDAVSTRLVPIPPGCPEPRAEQAVFSGTLVVRDAATARFLVGQIRSGDLEGYVVNGLVDVRYGGDVRFLDVGTTYLVGAAVDAKLRVLASTIGDPAPQFGGSEVASLDLGDLECPAVAEPVRTLHLDGTLIETGLLAPLHGSGRQILRAILQPIGVAILVLMGLAALKLLVFSVGRGLRDLSMKPTVRTRARKPPRIVRR